MINEDKKTVDDLFSLQFSLFFIENDVNEKQIKVLSRLLCRKNLDSLLQSRWFLRKKHCSVAIKKEDMHSIIQLEQPSNDPDALSPTLLETNWDNALSANINITEPLRLIQAVIKPLFIWWVNHITPQIFAHYETKKALELQINQCENIMLFEKKQLSNSNDPFLSLNDIKMKLETDKSKLIIINNLLEKDIQCLIKEWKNESVFNVEIKNTLAYLQEVTPNSELLKPIWEILKSIPTHPENYVQLKNWLLERSLCLKNDIFLWHN